MAEAFNLLFEGELIRKDGPWKGLDDVEFTVAECINWYNHRRLHDKVGTLPPAELKADCYS